MFMNKKFLTAAMLSAGILLSANVDAKTATGISSLEDGSAVAITGTVKAVKPNEFQLDFGDGTIPVEFKGWYWEGTSDNYLTNYFKPGDLVKVNGEIEDGFFSGKEIEASKVTKMDPASFNVTLNTYLNMTIYEYTPGKMTTLRVKN